MHGSQCWCSGSGGTDHTSEAQKDTTGHDNFNPTSFQFRDCKLITLGGVKWGC